MKKIISIIKRLVYIRRTVVSNNDKLENGRYNMTISGKDILYKKTENSIKFLKQNYNHTTRKLTLINKIVIFINKIIFSTIIVNIRNKQRNFNGSLIIFTRNGDIKIFDFNSKLIYNKIYSENRYESIIKSIDRFDKYFNTTYIKLGNENQSYIEKYVDFKPYNNWDIVDKEYIINKIFTSYKNYFRSVKDTKRDTLKISDLIVKLETFNLKKYRQLQKYISKYIDHSKSYRTLHLHGDLNFSNILLESKNIYITDFEYSGNYIFYYDIMNIICVESLFKNSDTDLFKFLDGYYDIYFDYIFGLFDVKYKSDTKIKYILIYIINRITKFQYYHDRKNIDSFVNNCIDLLEKLN